MSCLRKIAQMITNLYGARNVENTVQILARIPDLLFVNGGLSAGDSHQSLVMGGPNKVIKS